MRVRKRNGFTLIEMVIVILILGIIAAVAAPRMFNTASTAEENATRQQLAVLRNAIEMFRAQTGAYPANGQLDQALGTILNGPFPAPSMGANRGSTSVYYDTVGGVNEVVKPKEDTGDGWAYNPANGTLKLNVEGETGDDW